MSPDFFGVTFVSVIPTTLGFIILIAVTDTPAAQRGGIVIGWVFVFIGTFMSAVAFFLGI